MELVTDQTPQNVELEPTRTENGRDRFQSREHAAPLAASDRTEYFSDGVFAITITLLVIDIGRPAAANGDLLQELIHQWPSYVAFFVSFIYVGVVWMNHHGLFRHIRYVDRRLQWINLGILMLVVLLPFPTAVLAEALAQGNPHNERVAVALYALLAGAMSAVWIPLFRYLRTHPYLLESPVDTSYFEVQGIRPLTGVTLYSLAGVIGLLSPMMGLALFAVVALFYAVTSDGVSPRQRTS